MPTSIDPITGLPLDLLNSPTIDQIQLGARTDFIDDFNPQGQPPPTLYPDQAPNVLATIGAKNPQNPRIAQALLTDGAGRLQVTAGAPIPITHSFADTAELAEATGYTFDLGIKPAVLMGFTASYMSVNYNGPDHPQHVDFTLVGVQTNKLLSLARFAIAYDGGPQFGIPFTIVRDWSPGLDISQYFPGDTDIEMTAIMNTVFGTISWTLQCAV